MHGRGLPCWWALPLEMLSTCTCYSLHVHAIAGCIGDGSVMCHLLIAQCGHLWFLHVSGFHWTTYCFPSTCQFSTSTRVMLPLDHVSLLHWTMCLIFISPRGRFLFDHVSQRCSSMFRIFIRPRGFTTSFHVSDFNSPRVKSWLLHVLCTGSSTCRIFIWSHSLS